MITEVESSFGSPVHATLYDVRQAFMPPPELTVSQFSDQEIVLTSGPLAGTKWQTDFAPYQRGILDAVHEVGVEFIVVKGSSQWGKTACAVNIVAYHIGHDPCHILIVEPTVDPMARDFAKNRLEPTIKASPMLAAVVDKKRAKDASNTTLSKTFRGGSLAMAGANSAASLAARPVRLLVLDEVDRYPPSLPGEGATLSVAIKRTTTYRSRRRVVMLSSPTLEDAPIDAYYKRGDQRKYFVPCPGCKHMHPYEWKNVIWGHKKNDEDPDGPLIPDPSSARLYCPECKYPIDDNERVAILKDGEWRATAPGRADHRYISFHLWEAYSPMSSLTEIVANFLAANKAKKAGDPEEMHTWQNTTLGEAIAPDKGDGVEPHSLLARREPRDVEVPMGACYLTAGVDTQDDRLEVLVLGWGPHEECWLVDRLTFNGNTEDAEPWDELTELLDREFEHASGHRLMISAACVDSGGHRTANVYDYARRMAARRVFAIIGREGNRPIVSSPSPRKWGKGKRKVPLYTIGVDSAKAIWASRLKLTDKGPGYVHLPIEDWCDEEFALQMTSEVLVKKWDKGVPRDVWKKLRARNEAWDCAVYGLGALRLQHPNLVEVARLLAAEPVRNESEVPAPVAAAAPKQKWIPRKSGWLRRVR